VPQSAEEADPGQWWVLEEIGHCPMTVDLLFHTCTYKGHSLRQEPRKDGSSGRDVGQNWKTLTE
jgi:hypothetical protein